MRRLILIALIVSIACAQLIPIPTTQTTTCLPARQTGPQLPSCFSHGGNGLTIGVTLGVGAPVVFFLVRRAIRRHRAAVEARTLHRMAEGLK